jgi:hypothetical protein
MRAALRRPALLLAGVVATTALTGCGGSEPDAEKPAEHGFSQAADLSTCHADATAAEAPYGDAFPEDWPFPPRTTVFNAEDRGADGTIVTGISTAPFKDVLAHMNGAVVDAGFTTDTGETEEHDAEAEWDGNGFRGRWAIRESAQCPGETVVQVLSAPE